MDDKVKKQYKEAWEKHGNSVNSLFIPKGRQKERFVSLTSVMKKNTEGSLLDFGCGLGHLSEFLKSHYPRITYNGCDFLPEFIEQCRKNFPAEKFFHVSEVDDISESYDFIAVAGVFNMMYVTGEAENRKLVYEMISKLFWKTKKVLSLNFMTDQVDFTGEGAYHQNIFDLYEYSRKNFSKRMIIDQSYMPYEFTIHIFRNDSIVRPDNIFPDDV